MAYAFIGLCTQNALYNAYVTSQLVSVLRTLRKMVDSKERQTEKPVDDETRDRSPMIGAEKAEKKEYDEARKKDEVPNIYRTKIDKY